MRKGQGTAGAIAFVFAGDEVKTRRLMLWDGKSKGTINNVVNLSRSNKLVVVYVAPSKTFQTVRSIEDLKDVLAQGDAPSVDRLVHELDLAG